MILYKVSLKDKSGDKWWKLDTKKIFVSLWT